MTETLQTFDPNLSQEPMGAEYIMTTSLSDISQTLRENREHFVAPHAAGEQVFPLAVSAGLWNSINNHKITEAVQAGNYSPAELDGLLDEVATTADYMGKLSGQHPDDDYVLDVITKVPDANLRDAYFSDDIAGGNKLKQALVDRADHAGLPRPYEATVRVLSRLYGVDPTKLHSDEVAMTDPLVRSVVENRRFIPMQVTEMMTDMPLTPGRHETRQEHSVRLRAYAEHFLTDQLELPEALSDGIQRASRERTMFKDDDSWNLTGDQAGVNPVALRDMLNKTGQAVLALGVEGVAKLREQCGIVNLDNYAVQQLKRMLLVADGDPETIKHLQEGDTTVIFADALGDHNGSDKRLATDFESESGRTLLFETNQASDYYRHMIFLKQRGIQPSTAVIATHGSAGKMVQGEGRDAFALTNMDVEAVKAMNESNRLLGSPLRGASIVDAEGIQRLVTDFMQDSKGIDDDAASVGRRKIILLSCSQDAARVVRRKDADGNLISVDKSTLDSLHETIDQPDVDIYAAQASVSVKTTERGFKFATKQGVVPATRIYRGSDGMPVKEYVEEVILRDTRPQAKPVIPPATGPGVPVF